MWNHRTGVDGLISFETHFLMQVAPFWGFCMHSLSHTED